MVLVRDPEAAVRSLVVRNQRPEHVDRYLGEYIGFYGAVRRCLPQVLVVPFHQVHSDIGAIFHDLNSKFGTDFAAYEPTAQNEAAVAAKLAERNRGRGDNYWYLPSQQRAAALAAVDWNPNARMLKRAKSIHSQVLS